MVMFYSTLLTVTLPAHAFETKFNMFQNQHQAEPGRTNEDLICHTLMVTHYWYNVPIVSVCSSSHRLKQIKLCFNSHASSEAARVV